MISNFSLYVLTGKTIRKKTKPKQKAVVLMNLHMSTLVSKCLHVVYYWEYGQLFLSCCFFITSGLLSSFYLTMICNLSKCSSDIYTQEIPLLNHLNLKFSHNLYMLFTDRILMIWLINYYYHRCNHDGNYTSKSKH